MAATCRTDLAREDNEGLIASVGGVSYGAGAGTVRQS